MSRYGLRIQALLLSVFFLVVPLVGYLLIERQQDILVAGQTSALSTKAQWIAASLADNELAGFANPAGKQALSRPGLYAYPIHTIIRIDGREGDWDFPPAWSRRFDAADTTLVDEPTTLAFYLTIGRNRTDLYLLLQVIDDHVVYREPGSLSVSANDQVQLALMDESGRYRRFTIAPVQPGPAAVHELAPGGRAIRESTEIEAAWQPTPQGYTVEIRIPRNTLADRLTVAVTDVDDRSLRLPTATIGTAPSLQQEDLGYILLSSPATLASLDQLTGIHSRVRVIDRQRRLVMESGDIATASGIWQQTTVGTTPMDRWFETLLPSAPDPGSTLVDDLADPANVQLPGVDAALAGRPGLTTRALADGTIILSSVWPVLIDDEVMAAVILDETNTGIQRLRQQMMRQTMVVSAIIVALLTTLLLLFTTALAIRLALIRKHLDATVDQRGMVRVALPLPRISDELSQLMQVFARTSERIRQYNNYLEDVSRRLAHELRTPVTVVRSSLDNLALEPLDEASSVYLRRAQEGADRLATTLTHMTEGTRLEESLASAEPERFDLPEVVRGCMQGHEIAYPQQAFNLAIEGNFESMTGVPDLIAQLLDKLISNAVDFAYPGTAIRVRLTRDKEDAVLRIVNDGPNLPEQLADGPSAGMVSVRQGQPGQGAHLGLGLYIARVIADFHGGSITIANRDDTAGVIVTMRLPLLQISTLGWRGGRSSTHDL